MKIGLNLYGAAKWLSSDFGSDLERLKQIGFTSTEVVIFFVSAMPSALNNLDKARAGMGLLCNSVWFDIEADDKMKLLSSHGLGVIGVHIFGCHLSDNALEAMLPAMKNFGDKHGIKYFVVSYNQSSIEAMDKYIPTINKVAAELKKDSKYLVYHNHETECYPVNGTTVLDYIMEKCPDLLLQIDVGWTIFAGGSPTEQMKKYRDRLIMLHLKDIRQDASQETREICFTAIGEGCIPLKEILAEAKNCNLDENGMIIDQDNSPGNIYDDYEIGIKNIREILGH